MTDFTKMKLKQPTDEIIYVHVHTMRDHGHTRTIYGFTDLCRSFIQLKRVLSGYGNARKVTVYAPLCQPMVKRSVMKNNHCFYYKINENKTVSH